MLERSSLLVISSLSNRSHQWSSIRSMQNLFTQEIFKLLKKDSASNMPRPPLLVGVNKVSALSQMLALSTDPVFMKFTIDLLI